MDQLSQAVEALRKALEMKPVLHGAGDQGINQAWLHQQLHDKAERLLEIWDDTCAENTTMIVEIQDRFGNVCDRYENVHYTKTLQVASLLRGIDNGKPTESA